jgi:hypothetical protein
MIGTCELWIVIGQKLISGCSWFSQHLLYRFYVVGHGYRIRVVTNSISNLTHRNYQHDCSWNFRSNFQFKKKCNELPLIIYDYAKQKQIKWFQTIQQNDINKVSCNFNGGKTRLVLTFPFHILQGQRSPFFLLPCNSDPINKVSCNFAAILSARSFNESMPEKPMGCEHKNIESCG